MRPRPVVVTTAHRGVFFGYATASELRKCREVKSIALTRAKNCIYWSADMRGFMGLAAIGPSNTCRIGPSCGVLLHDVTSILKVGRKAEQKWNAA